MSTGSGNSLKHQQIYEVVRDRIVQGTFRPGDRMPTDLELVAEFGVSRPTVAKALRELERVGYVQRKPGSGTYVLDMGGEGRQFGLLIPGLGETEIFEPVCGEMAQCSQQLGHTLLWGVGTVTRFGTEINKEELALELCHEYIEGRTDGVFFAPLELTPNHKSINRQIVKSFDKAGIPVILLDRDYLPYPERSSHDLVGVDNRRVGYLITQHLYARGCQKVMFITRPNSASTIDARIAGFTEAVIKEGGSFCSSLVHRIDPRDESRLSRILREQSPDGVVCGNDVTAGILMHSLNNLGVRVPDEILVAGIDDVKYAELLRVPLTTVKQPCAAIGAAACRTMLDRLENPEQPARDILLGCELVIRESTSVIKRKGK
jgi:GntR family transcriptional regulator, arabinose operon transcriptional repressor